MRDFPFCFGGVAALDFEAVVLFHVGDKLGARGACAPVAIVARRDKLHIRFGDRAAQRFRQLIVAPKLVFPRVLLDAHLITFNVLPRGGGGGGASGGGNCKRRARSRSACKRSVRSFNSRSSFRAR